MVFRFRGGDGGGEGGGEWEITSLSWTLAVLSFGLHLLMQQPIWKKMSRK